MQWFMPAAYRQRCPFFAATNRLLIGNTTRTYPRLAVSIAQKLHSLLRRLLQKRLRSRTQTAITKEPRSNKMNLRGRLLRFDGVVPLPMESVSHDIESSQFFIRHFSAGWVDIAIFDRRHAESFLGRGV